MFSFSSPNVLNAPILVTHYIKRIAAEHQKQIENISRADLAKLCDYAWPGNVRELVNVLERSVISSRGPSLKLDWNSNDTSENTEQSLSYSLEEIEKKHILKILSECNWQISGLDGAAVKLGLNPNTLRSRMKKMRIYRTHDHGSWYVNYLKQNCFLSFLWQLSIISKRYRWLTVEIGVHQLKTKSRSCLLRQSNIYEYYWAC